METKSRQKFLLYFLEGKLLLLMMIMLKKFIYFQKENKCKLVLSDRKPDLKKIKMLLH